VSLTGANNFVIPAHPADLYIDASRSRIIGAPGSSFSGNPLSVPEDERPWTLAILDVHDEVPTGWPEEIKILRCAGYEYKTPTFIRMLDRKVLTEKSMFREIRVVFTESAHRIAHDLAVRSDKLYSDVMSPGGPDQGAVDQLFSK
jgi:hypothetical protein